MGILGGMGPESTNEFFKNVIVHTPAVKDQDHVAAIIYNNPKIPDRSMAITGKGDSPLQMLIKSLKVLEKAGADFIVIPCNSAHFWINELREIAKVPVLSMIEISAETVYTRTKLRNLGIMATTGTVNSGIYVREFKKRGISLKKPRPEDQDRLMDSIYEIKSGKKRGPRKIVLEIAGSLCADGAEGILCGCTEIPLVLDEKKVPFPVIDPAKILAIYSINYAKGINLDLLKI